MPGGIAPWKKPRATRLQQVTDLTKGGKSAKDVAAALGISLSMAHLYIREAREAGMLPPRPLPVLLRGKDDPALGSMKLMLSLLPEEVRLWVYTQVPKGSTVAELAAAILADAYADETGD